MASEQFQSHYYNVNRVQLPIRWMAPECISNVRHMVNIFIDVIWIFLGSIYISIRCMVIWYNTLGSYDTLFHATLCSVA